MSFGDTHINELAIAAKDRAEDRAQLHATTSQYIRTNGYIGLWGLLGDLLINLGKNLQYTSCLVVSC